MMVLIGERTLDGLDEEIAQIQPLGHLLHLGLID